MNEPGSEVGICAIDVRAEPPVRQGFVYFITGGDAIKIGYSADPKLRRSELQTGSARLLRLLAAVPGTEEIESAQRTPYSRGRSSRGLGQSK